MKIKTFKASGGLQERLRESRRRENSFSVYAIIWTEDGIDAETVFSSATSSEPFLQSSRSFSRLLSSCLLESVKSFRFKHESEQSKGLQPVITWICLYVCNLEIRTMRLFVFLTCSSWWFSVFLRDTGCISSRLHYTVLLAPRSFIAVRSFPLSLSSYKHLSTAIWYHSCLKDVSWIHWCYLSKLTITVGSL